MVSSRLSYKQASENIMNGPLRATNLPHCDYISTVSMRHGYELRGRGNF
jgi:hypothetical protein